MLWSMVPMLLVPTAEVEERVERLVKIELLRRLTTTRGILALHGKREHVADGDD